MSRHYAKQLTKSLSLSLSLSLTVNPLTNAAITLSFFELMRIFLMVVLAIPTSG